MRYIKSLRDVWIAIMDGSRIVKRIFEWRPIQKNEWKTKKRRKDNTEESRIDMGITNWKRNFKRKS